MTLQLCFGCLHPFPEDTLQPVTSFGTDLTSRLESVRSLIAKVAPSNAQTRQCIAGMEDELKALTLSIDAELREKQRQIDELAVQVKFFSAHDEDQRRRQRLAEQQRLAVKPLPRQQSKNDGAVYASKLLQRFLAASTSTPERPRNSSEGTRFTVENRFGETVSTHHPGASHGLGAGDLTPRRAPGPKPLDLVSATLYNVLEHLTVRTQAALGVLWLRCESNDELVAPFLVGADVKTSRYGVAPQHIRVASTTVGTVFTTGVAVNVIAPPGPGAEETLHASLEATKRSTLVLPIFKKYSETNRECHGALQLIAWADASPFSTADESVAATAADMLTHSVGMYHAAFIGDWTTRTFDPTAMLKAATYIATLDTARGTVLGSNFGGVAECIAATRAPYLIYRAEAGVKGQHTDMSGPHCITRQDMAAQGVMHVTVRDALKDVHRYTATLESSWKGAVAGQAELQRRNDQLQEQLDRARHGLNEVRRGGGSHGTNVAFMSASGTNLREMSESLRRAPGPAGNGRPRGLATFSGAELDDLEVDTVGRLRAAEQDKRRHKPQPPASTQLRPARAALPTFLTQDPHTAR
jgi:hypothetical protein